MSDDFVIEAAYAIWRMDMWMAGYGTYDDIEWAVGWRLLRPFRKQQGVRGKIAKKIIRLRRRFIDKDNEL